MLKFLCSVLGLGGLCVAALGGDFTTPIPTPENPTVMCVTWETTTTAMFQGAPITAPAKPTCFLMPDSTLTGAVMTYQEGCNTKKSAGTAVPKVCSNSEILNFIGAEGIDTQMMQAIANFTRIKASQDAANAVTPPTVTPAP
jgi:hypothetical protein